MEGKLAIARNGRPADAGPLHAEELAFQTTVRERFATAMNWKAAKPERWDGGVAIILAHGAGQGTDSPFMRFFHEALPQRGFLSVQFNFEYMDQGRKIPDPQPKMQALYRQIVQRSEERRV